MLRPPAADGGAAAFTQTFTDTGARSLDCRDQSEEHPGDDRHEDRKRQHSHVERRVRYRRQRRRQEQEQSAEPPPGEQYADGAGNQRQRDAFDELFSDEPASTRTEGVPNAELALSCRRPNEQQIRDIGAGDEQYEADRREQYEQRRAHAADELVAEREDPYGPAGVEVGILLGNLRGDRVQIGFGLLARDPIIQPPDHREALAFTHLPPFGREHVERPQFGTGGKAERLRQFTTRWKPE